MIKLAAIALAGMFATSCQPERVDHIQFSLVLDCSTFMSHRYVIRSPNGTLYVSQRTDPTFMTELTLVAENANPREACGLTRYR